MHIPTCAGLVSLSVTFFSESELNRCQIFFVAYNLVHYKYSFLLLTSYKSALCFKFSILLQFTALFIDLCNDFQFLFASNLLCVLK